MPGRLVPWSLAACTHSQNSCLKDILLFIFESEQRRHWWPEGRATVYLLLQEEFSYQCVVPTFPLFDEEKYINRRTWECKTISKIGTFFTFLHFRVWYRCYIFKNFIRKWFSRMIFIGDSPMTIFYFTSAVGFSLIENAITISCKTLAPFPFLIFSW